MIRDRFTRGFVAGTIAGIPTVAINFGAYYLNLTILLWTDFMGLFTYGRKPAAALELIFSLLALFFFLGLLGAIMAYLLALLSSGNYLFKGWIFGVSIWFAAFALAHLFGVRELQLIPPLTAATNFIAASVWGLLLALTLAWADNRLKL